MNAFHPSNTDVTLATMGIGLAFGKVLEELVNVTPALAAMSYLVAIVAGVITIYFKFKNRGS